MRRHIAFLHTSPVHVEPFERLVKAADPAVEVEHVVAEDLLAEAQRVGADDAALILRVQEAMARAAGNGAALVVCTCSTLGGAAERTPTGGRFSVARIDRAMADRAVALGPRVLVVAALESTLGPTAALIRQSAAAVGAEVTLEPLLVADAWPHFLRGDRAAYVAAVAAAVRAALAAARPEADSIATSRADVVVLALASMAPAVELLGHPGHLGDRGVEVLASPALGVQSALAFLRGGEPDVQAGCGMTAKDAR